jgi:hypothetical protein
LADYSPPAACFHCTAFQELWGGWGFVLFCFSAFLMADETAKE